MAGLNNADVLGGLNCLSALSSLGTTNPILLDRAPRDVESQLPFGFKFTWNSTTFYY